MFCFSTWLLSVLHKKWWKVQLESTTPGSMQLDVELDDNHDDQSRCLVDLTAKVVREFAYATAQGNFGDVWKCKYVNEKITVEVAVKSVRIEIQDDLFKDTVNKRLMADFRKWKPLRHENILPLYGITYGFGPVPAIVFPWMRNGSLSEYLDKNHGSLSEAHKFGLLADVAAGLQYLHSNEIAHANLTGSNVLINSDGRALVADYGLLTTCSDLKGNSYIRSNVRWIAPELFEVPDTEDANSPKLESDIYSFGCIAYQVLSGKQPYCNIRSEQQVVEAILKGVKPKRPDIPAIKDCHWHFIEQCWVELSQRPLIADVRIAIEMLCVNRYSWRCHSKSRL